MKQGTIAERLALDGLRQLFVAPKLTPDKVLELAAQMYAGLSSKDKNEVEHIALDRSGFAGRRICQGRNVCISIC